MNLLRTHAGILALILFTLLLRGGLMVARFDQLRQDPDDYHRIAHNIVRFATFSVSDPTDVGQYSGEPVPSAYRPPLYPVILSNLHQGQHKTITWQAIALLHVALGVFTVWLTWLIARGIGLDRNGDQGQGWASYVAGLLVACDPILLNQQSLVMTETLAAACTVLAWGMLVRFHFDRNWWNAALAGAAIGLAALCRPTFLPWLGFAAVAALFLQPGRIAAEPAKALMKDVRKQWGLRIINALAFVIGGLALMSPWAIRNYQVFQRPLLTTTHGGYTLYLANNKHFYSYLRKDQTGLPWNPRSETRWGNQLQFTSTFRGENRSLVRSADTGGLDYQLEFRVSNLQSQAARQEIMDDPAGFLLAAWFRIRQLWTPLPFRLDAEESTGRMPLRYATATWYCAVYALALVSIYQLRGELLRSPWVWGLALCVIFTGVHVFYWSNLRMRAPLMPIVAVLAAAAVGQHKWQAGTARSTTGSGLR